MNGPELLHKHADHLKSRMGGCFLGDRVISRGFNLHTELHTMDWMEYYAFTITGRRFTPKQLRIMNALWLYTSYPDARIWNLRIAALAGSTRSTGNLGMSASLAVSEAAIYGRGIDIRAIDFLQRTLKEMENGADLADCVKQELEKNRGIAGFGRPLSSADERIAPTMALACEVGFDQGSHVKLAFAIEDYLQAGRWRFRINAGGLFAALGADLGLTAQEYYLFMFPAFLGGTPPCYIESAENPEGTLFPLSCAHILYEGAPKRQWPSKGI